MSLLNFGKSKTTTLEESLSTHEQNAKDTLSQKHPHTVGLFDKHKVDLKEIRHKGTKAAAAATILGAFLAFPHLLGHGAVTEKAPDPSVQTLGVERQVDSQAHKNNTGGPTINPNTVSVNNSASGSNPTVDPNNDGHGSQGHIHGRSYMAPPKEHGYHDLGLHKGEDNGQGNAEAPGPHPEDLGINHPNGGPK